MYGGFGSNQKVVLAKTIAEIHGMPVSEINRNINNNIKRFKDGV
ncbi:MAG: ORF6N domain-containing protein, partial [Turicibacter sp.]